MGGGLDGIDAAEWMFEEVQTNCQMTGETGIKSHWYDSMAGAV